MGIHANLQNKVQSITRRNVDLETCIFRLFIRVRFFCCWWYQSAFFVRLETAGRWWGLDLDRMRILIAPIDRAPSFVSRLVSNPIECDCHQQLSLPVGSPRKDLITDRHCVPLWFRERFQGFFAPFVHSFFFNISDVLSWNVFFPYFFSGRRVQCENDEENACGRKCWLGKKRREADVVKWTSQRQTEWKNNVLINKLFLILMLFSFPPFIGGLLVG